MLWSEGAITLQDCRDMTYDELYEWYIRLGEAHGETFNYEQLRFEERIPPGAS